jgi:histidinol-phosphate/aromatic aminotransferase/cobyric acid decarboxylase-like protein
MNAYGYPTYIRITVGLPAENKRFIKALATVLNEVDRV